MKRFSTLAAMLVLGVTAAAAAASQKAQVNASLLVTGRITVSTTGTVTGYQLDQPDKLPTVVTGMLAKSIPHWRFKPVLRNGVAVTAGARMTLRFVARPLADGRYNIRLAGYRFGSPNTPQTLREGRIDKPRYPMDARWNHVEGIVYLIMRVNRQGKVAHVAAEQVNLMVRGNPAAMQRWRNELAKASVFTARNWTFKVPTTGPEASKPYWIARVPVSFSMTGPAGRHRLNRGYGVWVPYIPGPREPIPWLNQGQLASGSADAQVPGTLSTGPQKLQLMTTSSS